MGDGENPYKKPEADSLLGRPGTWIIAAPILPGGLALAPVWYRLSIRTAANIMAKTFYGEAVLDRDFTSRTVAGLALYVWRIINPLITLYTHRGPIMAADSNAGHSDAR
jgi:hypothetical protein